MSADDVVIPTAEGAMGTYVTCPDRPGPHPVVLFLMDAPGKRPLLESMARRITAEGYYVMLPNLYYRWTPEFELDFSSKESYARMRELMYGLGNQMVARDTAALMDFAQTDRRADASQVGIVGYCMSGPFALYCAGEHRDRVKAAASFYGVRLVVDAPDSPHLRLPEVAAEIYVAAAEHDDYVPLSMIDQFEAAMQAAAVRGHVERYWGTHHGFAFNDRPAHDASAEARHWSVLGDLLARNLGRAGSPGGQLSNA
jgi:carboxymethylenebutenolidase